MAWLNAAAPMNMPSMFVTRPVFQALMPSAPPLLNAAAPLNMYAMLVTLDTSQVPMSLLKALAPLNAVAPKNIFGILAAFRNMYAMLVTLDTSQVPMSLLKALAPSNVPCMLVTLAVFHLEMSALNC